MNRSRISQRAIIFLALLIFTVAAVLILQSCAPVGNSTAVPMIQSGDVSITYFGNSFFRAVDKAYGHVCYYVGDSQPTCFDK